MREVEELFKQTRTDEDWSAAGGCKALHPFNRSKREACEERVAERKANKPRNVKKQTKADAKYTEAEAKLKEAEALKALAEKPAEKGMGPLAIVGIVAGSLAMITIMIVVIKKVGSKS